MIMIILSKTRNIQKINVWHKNFKEQCYLIFVVHLLSARYQELFLFANSLYKIRNKYAVVYKMFSHYHNSAFIEMSCEIGDIHFNRWGIWNSERLWYLHVVVTTYWLQFTEHSLSACHCIKYFTCIILCNPQNLTIRQVLFSNTFSKWGNWSLEWLSNLPRL